MLLQFESLFQLLVDTQKGGVFILKDLPLFPKIIHKQPCYGTIRLNIDFYINT